MDLLIPDFPGLEDRIGALSTMRRGGVSLGAWGDEQGSNGMNLGAHVGDKPEHVARNRAILRSLLPAEPAWLNQVHGAGVVNARDVAEPVAADASLATAPGVVCVIQTADCLPVLFADVNGRVVGAAHAGWRGLAGGVLENTVEAMRTAGAADIMAWMGPAIGPDNFEVGAEVRDAFVARDAAHASAFRPVADAPGKYLADIYALATRTLSSSGVERITGGGRCTVAEAKNFFSYRRDKTTGRMASLIWLKS